MILAGGGRGSQVGSKTILGGRSANSLKTGIAVLNDGFLITVTVIVPRSEQ